MNDIEAREHYRHRQAGILIGYLLSWSFPVIIMTYRGLTGYGDYDVSAIIYPIGFYLINGDPSSWDAYPAVIVIDFALIFFIVDIIWILVKCFQLRDTKRLVDIYGLVGCHLLFAAIVCLIGLFAWHGFTLEAYASIIISIIAWKSRGERVSDVWIDPLRGNT